MKKINSIMPELYRFNAEEDCLRVGVWHITETLDKLRSLATDADIALYKIKGAGEKRMAEWIASRLLAKNVLDKNVEVRNDVMGKPYLSGMPGNISIAHTRDYAVVLYTQSIEMGVDVERRDRNVKNTCSRYMNNSEMLSLGGERDNDVALLHWVVKEALFKVTGDVGGTFKDNITLAPFELGDTGTIELSLHNVDSEKAGRYIAWYAFEKDFVFALCYRLVFGDIV